MSGCTFNAVGNFTSGCGFGGDTINFDPALTQVVLTSRLPFINKDGLTVNGTVAAGNVIIDGNGGLSGTADYAFNIEANNVTLRNLTVINIYSFGAAVALGNGNWKGLRVYNNFLGVTPTAHSCSDPAIKVGPYFDVILFGGRSAPTAIWVWGLTRTTTAWSTPHP